MLSGLLITFAAITTKAVMWFALCRMLRPRFGGILESALAAWLGVQAVTYGGLLLLSAFGSLTTDATRLGAVGLAIILATVAARPRFTRPLPLLRELLASDRPLALAALGLATGALLVRGTIFYDSTDDALFYGFTRIAFWIQQQSILAHQATDAAYALFYFPWNGELNALYYFLFTGADRACAVGNVETWLACGLTLAFAFRTLGCPTLLAGTAAFSLACMPVTVLLAMTVKGDLPAITGATLGLVWTWRLLQHGPSPGTCLGAIAAFCYAAGSKTTCLPLAGVFCLFHLYFLLRIPSHRTQTLLAVAVIAGLFCSRYLVNLLTYGKIAGSSSVAFLAPSPSTWFENLRGLFREVLLKGIDLHLEFALFAGTGLVGAIAIALLFTVPLEQWRPLVRDYQARRTSAWVGVALFLGSLLLVTACVPWMAWSFRYYLPWLLLPLLVPFALRLTAPDLHRPGPPRLLLIAGLILSGILHFLTTQRPSDLVPGPSFSAASRAALATPDLERKFFNHPELVPVARRLLHDATGSPRPRRVLVLCGEYALIYPFLGDNASNPLDFVASPSALLATLAERRHDLVLIGIPYELSDHEQQTLGARGYRLTETVSGLTFVERIDHET